MKVSEICIRDPFVFVEDDVMYLIGTTPFGFYGLNGLGFLGFKSTDMVNFEGPYVLFNKPDDFWSDREYWAPELHKIDGKYYIFASFKAEDKCRASHVLVSDTVFGEYKPLPNPITPGGWECLDATYYEENGKKYTVFCHEWLQCVDGEMVLAELTDDFCGIKGEPKILFKATDAKWVTEFTMDCFAHGGYITDGPFLYKLKSGKLLMLWSSFGKDGYAMGMAVSSNGINGPWEQLDKPLFSQDGGHGMIFDFKGKTYVSLHYPNGPDTMERPHFYEITETENSIELK